MIRTYFYLKTDKQNSNGESAIYAKIKCQGKTSTLSTGKYIDKGRWEATYKLKNTLRVTSEKNTQTTLKLIESKIESIYLELVKVNANVTLSDVKNQLNNVDQAINILTAIEKTSKLINSTFNTQRQLLHQTYCQ